MKRKFVKVMFFGALALSTVTYVGCKDYDDDIKNVQEQIDAINKKGADVTTEAMTAAINSAVAGLQTQLDAIASKADKTALDELKKTVTDLQAALNNKADAIKLTKLQTKLDEAIAKVNASIESSVGAAKTELQAKIDKLQADLEKADADAAEKIATELAAVKTELQGLINANGEKIADLYEKIKGLDAIKTKIEALEEADKNFVTISQLNDYMNSEAVKAYVDEALVDYLTSAEVTEQVNAVKTYVDGTFKAAIMAEIKAEYLSLEKYNADMEALMEKIDTYVGKEDAAYKKIFTDITALQTYQQQTIEVLVASLAENNTIENANKIVGALEDITTLQTEIAKCAKTTDLDAYVKGTELGGLIDTHLQDKFAGYDGEIADIKKRLLALEIDVDGLKSMVQSVTFVPSDSEGKVYFSSYYVVPEGETEKTLIASNNTVTVKFRVSPVSAAKNFFDNYTASFDAQEITTRAANIFEGEGKVENADEGIISFVISTTTEQSHAVCLNIIAKNSVPENAETAIKGTDYFTNINSNYFPVIVTTKTISGIQVESTNSTVSSIYYNKEASKIDYKAGVALKARFVDGGNATLDPENVDLSNLVTSYEFDKDMTNPDAPVILDGDGSYKLEDGVLSLKNYAAESAGKEATVVAYVAVKDGDNTLKEFKSTAYAKVTAANYTDGTVNLTPVAPTDVLYDGTKVTSTSAYALTELYTSAGSKDIYEAIPVDKFTPTADKGVTFVIGEKNALTINVPKGTAAGTYSPTLKIQVDAVKVINVSASVKVSYQDIKVVIDGNIVSAGAMTLKPTYQGSYEKPTSVGFTLDLATLYTNYATQLAAVKKVGGDITLTLKDAVKGASINGTTLTVDKTYNAHADDINPIVIVAKTVYGEATLDNSTVETKINLTEISGTWAFTIKSAAFGKDNLNSTLNIAKTASWTDYRGKVMWADGAEKAQGTTEWGAKPLSVYGFTAPVFSIATADADKAKYVNITTDGKISLTDAGKNLASAITLKVNVAAVSNWGTITDFASNNEVTVKIDLSQDAADI